jgi:hypothetical protein
MARFSFADWWRLDESEERRSADNPLSPVTDAQRRDGGPPRPA